MASCSNSLLRSFLQDPFFLKFGTPGVNLMHLMMFAVVSMLEKLASSCWGRDEGTAGCCAPALGLQDRQGVTMEKCPWFNLNSP